MSVVSKIWARIKVNTIGVASGIIATLFSKAMIKRLLFLALDAIEKKANISKDGKWTKTIKEDYEQSERERP